MSKINDFVARVLRYCARKIGGDKGSETMEDRIQRYRNYGAKIGEKNKIYSELGYGRDLCLLSIGNNVTISGNVTFLMHDNAVIKPTKGKYTDVLGRVSIGDNCFIGHSSIILPGVSIATGCIVGAGSVVVKSIINDNTVYAGNPAKYICTVEEYVDKNKDYMVNLDGMTGCDILKLVEDKSLVLKER